MLQTSTGLRNRVLDTAALRTVLDVGFIKIYSGTPPATADAAVTGTLLCTISLSGSGTGLSFDTAATAGVISKPASAVWNGVNSATGVAGYYRHVGSSDTGVLSTTEARVQGAIAVSGSDMNLTSTTLTSGVTQAVDFYTLNLPTL